MKRSSILIILILVMSAGMLYAEVTWPKLIGKDWQNMTVEKLKEHLDSGVNVNARDADGWTALMWASLKAAYRAFCPKSALLAPLGIQYRLCELECRGVFPYTDSRR